MMEKSSAIFVITIIALASLVQSSKIQFPRLTLPALTDNLLSALDKAELNGAFVQLWRQVSELADVTHRDNGMPIFVVFIISFSY